MQIWQCKKIFKKPRIMFLISPSRVTHHCVLEKLDLLKTSLYLQYRRNIYSRFSNNSEEKASEFIKKLEKKVCALLIVEIES